MDVRMPDGVLLRNIPEGTTKAQILAKYKGGSAAPQGDIMPGVREQAAAMGIKPEDMATSATPSPSIREELGKSSEMVQNAMANGMTLGWGDEIRALGASLAPGGGAYSDQLAGIEKGKEDYAKNAPGALGTIELLGGMGTGSQIAKGLTKIPGVLNTAGKLTKKGIALLSAAGAGEGAITGAGYSGEGNRGTGAAIGGALGGALPVVSAPIGWAAGKIASKTAPYLGPIKRQAEETLGNILTKGRVMSKMSGNVAPGSVVADTAGDLGPALIGAAAKESPEFAQGAGANLLASGRTAPAKLLQQVNQAAGLPKTSVVQRMEAATGETVVAAEALPDMLKKNLSEGAKKDFAAVMGDVVEISPAVQKRLSADPRFLSDALTIARADGDEVAEIALKKLGAKLDPGELAAPIAVVDDGAGEAIKAISLTVKEADSVRKSMGDALQGKRYQNDTTGWLNRLGRSINNLKRDFTKELTDASPELGKALKNYGGRAEVIDAANMATKFHSMTPEVLEKAFYSMSPPAQKAYRTRVLAELADRSGKVAPDAAGVYSFLKSSNMTRKLELVFGKGKAAKVAKIAKEAEASALLNASGQTGPAGLSKLLAPENRSKLTEAIGGKKTGLIDNIVKRSETFKRTEDAVRAGSQAGASKAVSGIKTKEGAGLLKRVSGAHYLTPGVGKGKLVGAGVEVLGALKNDGMDPKVIAKIGEILSSSKDVEQAILRLSNADINKFARDKAISTLNAQRTAASTLMGAVAGGQASGGLTR